MRMNPGRWLLWLAPMVLMLEVANAGATSVDDSCFKTVLQQRAGDGTWLVRKCEAKETLRYRIAYRAAQAGATADITLHETDAIADVAYRIVGPATLLLDATAERGGQAYLLHPVDGRSKLSVATFRYMGDDEESLVVRMTGRRIRASTAHGTHVIDIGATGTLTRAVTTEKPQRPRS